MPQYMVQVELPRFQGREATGRDRDRLQELMSGLLFDQVTSSGSLRLPLGTFVGSSVDECEELGSRIVGEVQNIWPVPKIVLVRVKEMWSFGLKEASHGSILENSRSA